MCKVGVEPNCRGMGAPTTTVFRRVALLLYPPQGEAGKEIRKKKNEKWKREWKLYQCTRAAISRPPLRIYNTITANCISLYFTVFYCTLLALKSSSSAAQAFLFVFQHHSREYPISSAMSSKLILLRCLKSRNSSHCGGSWLTRA